MSTATASNTPDQTQKDAEEDLKRAYPDEESQQAARQQLVSSLTGSGVKRAADEDIKTLANTIALIRKDFVQVASDLLKFDNEKFKDQFDKPIVLSPKWRGFIEEFDSIIQMSLEQSVEAVAFMKQITSVLGEVKPEWKDDLVDELQNFVIGLEGKEKETLQLKNKFQWLSDNVKIFSSEIDVALEKAGATIAAGLKSAQARLEDIQTNLAQVNKEIESLGRSLKFLNGQDLEAVGTIAGLNAGTIIISIGKLVKATQLQNQLNSANTRQQKLETDLRTTEREVKQLQEREKLLDKYRKVFAQSKNTVQNISARIGVIANIWQTINLDMFALRDSISSQIQPGAVITKFWLSKLRVAKELYAHLTYLLEVYVEQVRAGQETK